MSYSWTTPVPSFTDGAGNGPTAAELDQLSGNLGFLHQEFPIRAEMWHKDSTVSAGNAMALNANNAYMFGHTSAQWPAQSGDTKSITFILAAGTYTLTWLGVTNNNSGIFDWMLGDSTSSGTVIATDQDWYSAGATANVTKTATVTLTENKRYVLWSVNDGKHASSSGYELSLTKLWFTPASDVT